MVLLVNVHLVKVINRCNFEIWNLTSFRVKLLDELSIVAESDKWINNDTDAGVTVATDNQMVLVFFQ